MPNFKFPSYLEMLRSKIEQFEGQPVQQVLLYSKGTLYFDVLSPGEWRAKMIYAFVATDRYQNILRLGYTSNPLDRLSPRRERNTLGHPDFINAQLLYPGVEVYGFIVNILTTERPLIPWFNPPLNVDGNEIKRAERHRDNRLEIYDYIYGNEGCDTTDLSSATGVGSTAANIYARELKNMGLITIEAGRSKTNRPKWIHGIPPMQ